MTVPMQVDESLKAFATDRQRELIDAVLEHGSAQQAARALGVDQSYLCKAIRNVKKRAEQARRQAAIAPKGTAGLARSRVSG